MLVPVESASEKEEYAARTIRSKITNKISYFAVPLKEGVPEKELKKTFV